MKRTTVLALASASTASAAVDFSAAPVSGDSTHYGGNLSGGTCSFTTYTLPSGIFGTAFSGSAWASSAVCGACAEVTGPKGDKIKVMVVDKCPECPPSHLDLFINAFSELDSPGNGIVSTSYTFVPCGITSPLKLHNKSGTSPYWFSMQVVNSNVPVEKLEVSVDGGKTWSGTTRQDYNFFENSSGFGTNEVDVKVTSINGESIVVKGVSVEADKETTAGSNFSGGDTQGAVAKPSSKVTAEATSAAQPSASEEPSAPEPLVPAAEPTTVEQAPAVSVTPSSTSETLPGTTSSCKPKGSKRKRSKSKKAKRDAKPEL